MGKTGKWIKSFLVGKKEKGEKERDAKTSAMRQNHPSLANAAVTEKPATPISTPSANPKEKRRWSFRRSSAGAAPAYPFDPIAAAQQGPARATFEAEIDQTKHAMAVAAATAAAADAAVAAAQAAAAVIRLTAASNGRSSAAAEEAAAVKIQSAFRSHLARKALHALKGLVRLQALVRGRLVRRQAAATLRCMQALVTAQARARAQRVRMVEEGKPAGHNNHNKQLPPRRSTQESRTRHSSSYEIERGEEENIKIVEMDLGQPKENLRTRNGCSNHPQAERGEQGFFTHYASSYGTYSMPDGSQPSPAPSALTEMTPRAYSGHLEDYSFTTAQSSPQCYSAMSSKPDPAKPPFAFPAGPDYAGAMPYDYPLYPNYMANTQSSRAKARSQSAPKQRPADPLERQQTRRRPSVEGRNVPRAMRMQRSSSHVGSTVQNYQHPWFVKLDRSMVSVKDSECGSANTVLSNINYCRSLAGFEHPGESRAVANI